MGHLTLWCGTCSAEDHRDTRFYEPATSGAQVIRFIRRLSVPINVVQVVLGPDHLGFSRRVDVRVMEPDRGRAASLAAIHRIHRRQVVDIVEIGKLTDGVLADSSA